MNFECTETYCSYCLKPYVLDFIKCNECNNISMCLRCFGYGVEGGNHRRNHSYSFKVCNIESKVFTNSHWSPDEELKLLNATELYGIGNWNDISDKVESHDGEECRDHYIEHYINGTIGRYLLSESSQRKCGVVDHSVNYTDSIETSKLSPSLFDVMPPCNLRVEDQVILGYMPKRDDFERDYDNDAESILCRLKPDFFKDELLDALKVAHVGIYTQRLKERQRRKVIAREHDLISPIIACVLNKRWKPATSDESLNSDNGNKSKPFTILSSNSLTPTQTTTRKHSRFLKKKIDISPTKKAPLEESGRSKPYDAFMISDSFKPFLRYLTYSHGKALLENLHREEILKYEISSIIEAMKRGRRRVLDVPFRYPAFSNIFVKSRPRLTVPLEMTRTASLSECRDNDCDEKAGRADSMPPTDVALAKKTRKRRKFKSYFFGIKRQR